jgi:hypothetical protein
MGGLNRWKNQISRGFIDEKIDLIVVQTTAVVGQFTILPYIIQLMKPMEVLQNPRTLEEICRVAGLDEYRAVLADIISRINVTGCRVATKYIEQKSTLYWSEPGGPLIRVNLQGNEEPLHVIWALLHEQGHLELEDLKKRTLEWVEK